MNFRTYLLTKNFNLMKRTKVKLLTALFLFAAFLFVQDAQAQSFVGNEVDALSSKSGIDPADFVPNTEAIDILKAEVEGLYTAAGTLDGGTAEATNSLKTGFYTEIMDRATTGESVIASIGNSYAGLVQHSTQMGVGVNVDNILDGVIDLLSN